MREGSPEPTRPVWVTEAQAERRGLIPQWSAAPDDAHEAIALCVSRWNGYGPDVQPNHRKCADAVVAALGGSQETTT